jgi:REP element-mobilizing transposase RayT
MGDFLNASEKILKHGADLPHWQQGEAMQFVTFRLGDAMPGTKLRQWREEYAVWLKHHPKPFSPEEQQEYHQRFTWKLESWLDEGCGSCLLRDASARQHLQETLMIDHGSRAIHHAWVIMPNHVHLLFRPKIRLEKLMQTWKGVSARRIGRGSIWQKNYRDTMIRDAGHFANAVRYIRRNPLRLAQGTFTLWQGELAMAVR